MRPDRWTFLRVFGAGSIGAATISLFGGSAVAATVISMQGGSDDIWGTADAFHYYYTELSGDFGVAVQNTSIDNVGSWTKVSLMVRESSDLDSENVMVRRRPNDEASIQYRPEDGVETDSVGDTPVDWLCLKRSGNAIEAYHSTDSGTRASINTLDAADILLSDSVYVGLVVTSHLSGTFVTAAFQSLSGVDPSRSRDIGDAEAAGSVENTTDAPLASIGDVTDIGPGPATFTGDLGDPGGAGPAECYFEYREVPTELWKITDSTELTSPGAFSVDTDDLTRRRYYEARAVADMADGDTVQGSVSTFNTPNPSNSKVPVHPGSGSASHSGPSDGLAEAAPWLDDDTPTTVMTEPTRRQLEKAITTDGERLIIFEISGTIDLGVCDLPIPYDKCYIVGQTAPSPDVTLVKDHANIEVSDCVLQYIRVQLGDTGTEDAIEDWALDTVNTADETTNNIVDHVPASWSVDECLSVGYETAETIVSNCLVTEALDGLVHPKGEHGYGSFADSDAKNVAVLGNVWTFNTDRHPRLREGTQSVVVNNVMYDFEDGTWLDPDTEASIVGNACFRPNSDRANVFTEDDVDTAVAYLEDNLTDSDVAMVDENMTVADERSLWLDGLAATLSDRTFDHNLANVGAHPVDRTATDERIFENVEGGESYLIDSQEQVGSYPDPPANSYEPNVPNDGTRPWFRSWSRRIETSQR